MGKRKKKGGEDSGVFTCLHPLSVRKEGGKAKDSEKASSGRDQGLLGPAEKKKKEKEEGNVWRKESAKGREEGE